MNSLLIIASLLPFCLAGCLKPTVVQHFNASAYLGKWYEQAKNPQIFEAGGKCTTAEYTLEEDGTIKVFNQLIRGGSTSSIEGTARIVSVTGEAKLEITFEVGISVSAPYWVVSTDYTSYAVVYSCSEIFGITYSSTAWILTREQHPPESLIEKAYNILEAQKIATKDIQRTDQTNCN